MLFNFLVAKTWHLFRRVHNSVSMLEYTLLIKLYSKNNSDPYPNLNVSYLTECEFVATFCAGDRSAPCWFVERKLGRVLNLNYKVNSVQNPFKSSSSASLLSPLVVHRVQDPELRQMLLVSSSLMSDVWDASSSVPRVIPAFPKPFLMDETFTAFQACTTPSQTSAWVAFLIFLFQ